MTFPIRSSPGPFSRRPSFALLVISLPHVRAPQRPLHLHTTCNTSTRCPPHAPPTHLSAHRPHHYAPDAAAPLWCCLCVTQVRSVCTKPSVYATDFPGSSDAAFEQAGDRITYKHSRESIEVSRARIVLPIVSKPSGIVSERPENAQIRQARQQQAGGEY